MAICCDLDIKRRSTKGNFFYNIKSIQKVMLLEGGGVFIKICQRRIIWVYARNSVMFLLVYFNVHMIANMRRA